MKHPLCLVIDVEAVGLHGEGFAVGWVALDPNLPASPVLAEGRHACDWYLAAGTAEGQAWVSKYLPDFPLDCLSPFEVREKFWGVWRTWADRGAVLVADVGWPVEAQFLLACVGDRPGERGWSGPLPLHELASLQTGAGLDPVVRYRYPMSELPEHDPLCDARQSARLLLEVFAKLSP